MPKYEKALFLYNGNAGKNDMEQKLSQTLPIITKAIRELTIVQTKSSKEAKETCIAFASKIDLLIILGGDGTVHTCINSIAALESRPVVAILPGGTSNDFSRMLRIPQNLYAAATAIVEGDAVPIDIGKSNSTYFLNFWGIGLVSETSQNIDEDQKENFGVLSYFMSTLRTVSQAEPFTYDIKTLNNQYEGEAVMVLVLNGKFLGTKELPIATVDPSDGKLDILIVKNSNIASFRELLAMNNPEFYDKEFSELKHFQATELVINTDETKEIDMDGEINETTPSIIEILPSHLQMIQGSFRS
ncbi:YegS/Rv2252/BmrU family lipid kinase [Virgibacillus sp. C22-A2]|uniref:YegS/Rv2252/BmrU family lipid kinase n=1 Tax=Virgibacillus tibetensis TaxID=3042313 RepID=A0ABU6KHA0_9BACI|nr:YegS/Rv2252/BmrU family lipid kinase [Virgibacillus sp. C22-A2]